MNYSLQTVIDRERIERRVVELGAEVSKRYASIDEALVMVCVLKGAFMFFSDLVRHLSIDPILDFVRLASYGKSTSRRGQVVFSKDMEMDITDRHVLIVEDIVDTGHSVAMLQKVLLARDPASVAVCALVDKYERREKEIEVDFSGFRLEKGFIVGYGLDYAEQFRHLEAICELKIHDA